MGREHLVNAVGQQEDKTAVAVSRQDFQGHRHPESWGNQVNVGYDEEQDALNREELNGAKYGRASYKRAGSQRVRNAENRVYERGDDEVQPVGGILLE